MQILSASSVVILLIVILGLVAASTRGLGNRERVACVVVTLVVPVIGALSVVVYVVAQRWRRTRSTKQSTTGL